MKCVTTHPSVYRMYKFVRNVTTKRYHSLSVLFRAADNQDDEGRRPTYMLHNHSRSVGGALMDGKEEGRRQRMNGRTEFLPSHRDSLIVAYP